MLRRITPLSAALGILVLLLASCFPRPSGPGADLIVSRVAGDAWASVEFFPAEQQPYPVFVSLEAAFLGEIKSTSDRITCAPDTSDTSPQPGQVCQIAAPRESETQPESYILIVQSTDLSAVASWKCGITTCIRFGRSP